jgi:hypothetical protein
MNQIETVIGFAPTSPIVKQRSPSLENLLIYKATLVQAAQIPISALIASIKTIEFFI